MNEQAPQELEPTPEPVPQSFTQITRAVDNSSLSEFDACERAYFYNYVMARTKNTKSAALGYGSAWHKGLEVYYATGGDVDAALAAMAALWQDPADPSDYRTLDRCQSALKSYINHWGDYDAEAKTWGKTVGMPDTPCIELGAEVWWPGGLHPYAVKIDRIVEHNGLVFVEDHKTTSQLGATYFQQYTLSNQMLGYVWVAQQLLERPVAGIRINAHGILKSQNKFERQVIHYSQETLKEWAANFNVRVARLARAFDLDPNREGLLEAWPRNYNACVRKYHTCQFIDVCTMPERIRAHALDTQFEHNSWNPFTVEE